MVIAAVPAAGGPGWTDILTAAGTVGAVIAAVAIALWTEWRSGKRIKEERDRSDNLLAEQRRLEKAAIEEERARSDRLLAEQREREKAAVEDERAHGKAQLEEERRLALEREQLAQAYAVQVAFGEGVVMEELPGSSGLANVSKEVKRLAVMVVNRSSFTITRIEAQFCLGSSMIPHHRYQRISGFLEVPQLVRERFDPSREPAMSGVLTPYDAGIRFETDGIHQRHLSGSYPVVRWTDQWGTRWEHKRGVVRRISEDEQWGP